MENKNPILRQRAPSVPPCQQRVSNPTEPAAGLAGSRDRAGTARGRRHRQDQQRSWQDISPVNSEILGRKPKILRASAATVLGRGSQPSDSGNSRALFLMGTNSPPNPDCIQKTSPDGEQNLLFLQAIRLSAEEPFLVPSTCL